MQYGFNDILLSVRVDLTIIKNGYEINGILINKISEFLYQYTNDTIIICYTF